MHSPWKPVLDDLTLRLASSIGRFSAQHASQLTRYGAASCRAANSVRDADRFHTPSFDSRSFQQQGALGAVPPSGRFGPYTPSPSELHVRSRHLSIDYELSHKLPSTNNGVFITRDSEGALYIYKPSHQESYYSGIWHPHVDGQLAIREVAGYRIFELIGADSVPPTAMVDGPRGPGMAQLYVPLKRSKVAANYPADQRARTALGHFLIGNADGHEGNFRPAHDGNPEQNSEDKMIVFDLGYSFPEKADPLRSGNGVGDEFQFFSPFIDEWAGAEFPQRLLDPIDALTADRVGSALEDLALSDSAIDLTLDRLAYIKDTRTIHGNPDG